LDNPVALDILISNLEGIAKAWRESILLSDPARPLTFEIAVQQLLYYFPINSIYTEYVARSRKQGDLEPIREYLYAKLDLLRKFDNSLSEQTKVNYCVAGFHINVIE